MPSEDEQWVPGQAVLAVSVSTGPLSGRWGCSRPALFDSTLEYHRQVGAVELMDVLRTRRSIRKYKPDPVPQEDIEYVLEAARLAPSWANRQCWKFVVITDEPIKRELAKAGNE